jgi:hypothetical protein
MLDDRDKNGGGSHVLTARRDRLQLLTRLCFEAVDWEVSRRLRNLGLVESIFSNSSGLEKHAATPQDPRMSPQLAQTDKWRNWALAAPLWQRLSATVSCPPFPWRVRTIVLRMAASLGLDARPPPPFSSRQHTRPPRAGQL